MSSAYKYNSQSPFVYDKAKYHYSADDFPKGAPIEQAYVHTGLFVGWLAANALLDESDPINHERIARFRRREITGPQLYGQLGECLIDYMLNEEGNLFARKYFDFKTGQFIPDYRELLVRGLGSDYAVEDTWENYEIIKNRFDQRYEEWKANKRG